MLVLAAGAVAAAWQGRLGARAPVVVGLGLLAVALVLAIGWRPLGEATPSRVGSAPGPAVALAALAAVVVVAGWRSATEWRAVGEPRLGPVAAPARLVTDPDPVRGAVRVVLEVEGQRFETWARGSPARRLRDLLAGEVVWVQGERRPGPGGAWRASRHVVGSLVLERVGDRSPAAPVHRAANRVRRLLEQGARTLAAQDRPLFAGLVYGDDRHQPPELVEAFRASGLSHLTAVSGQNVAFVLAAAGPGLRRLAPWPRWLASLGLIGWFAVLTRFEPSVLRAVTMAGLGATAYVTGSERSPVRLAALAVVLLVVVDPLLVWSVGWWLSTAATFGLATLAARLERALPGPRWLVAPFAVTLAAQLGVLPVTVLVFGWPPLVSLVANLLAVPVAGAVMLAGLPLALVASQLPDALAGVLLWAPGAGVRWVATVAQLAARAPSGRFDAAAWVVVLAGVAWRCRSRRRAPVRDAAP